MKTTNRILLSLKALALLSLCIIGGQKAQAVSSTSGIVTNIQNGDTVMFDNNGMIFFDAQCTAGSGNTMGTVTLTTSWGMDTQGSTSGSPSLEAGTFLFLDPYYPAGSYTVTVSSIDQAGHTLSKTVTFNVID